MPKCFFCGKSTPPARGKMFVRNDGKIFYFCNSKCQSNWKLRREGKRTRWTYTFQKEAKKQTKKEEKKAEQ